MPLVNLTTDLKSLKYGKDRPGGGSSKQPFIQTSSKNSFDLPIDKLGNEIAGIPAGPDFVLRGGLLAPARAATDASRLFQLFTQTPSGLQFTAKQNLLSRTAVATEASGGPGYGFGAVNQGIYTPVSTLGQALTGFAGTHLNLLGVDPTGLTPLGLIKYETIAKAKNTEIANFSFRGNNFFTNRLLNLTQNKITTGNSDVNILSYSGGPGSDLGIGTTNIKRYYTSEYTGLGSNFATLSSEEISKQTISKQSTQIQDFRNVVKKSKGFKNSRLLDNSGTLSSALDYSDPENRIETRLNLGDPGNRNIDRSNYETGDPTRTGVDKVNSLYLYKSSRVTTNKVKNDLVKFRIAVVDPDSPNDKTFIHFRSYLNGITDSYGAEWNDFRYLGRGENFHNYQGFNREMSLNWTVMAQSKQELSIMYQKLNYLASTLAPNYSDAGFMRGNIHQLTIGGYVYEYPGIITSLTFNTPDDSTWEIGIPIDKNTQSQASAQSDIAADVNVKELAHRIEVSMNFKPINPFLPQTIKNIDGAGSIDERFLSLTADSGNAESLYNKGIPDWANRARISKTGEENLNQFNAINGF